MKRHAALILMLGTLSLVACKKKDGDAPPAGKDTTAPATKEAPVPTPPPAGSGSAPAATPPPAGGGGGGGACADGAYKDPGGLWCVKAPEGYKPPTEIKKDADGKMEAMFMSEDGFNFSIEIWDESNSIKFENFKKDYGKDDNGSKVTGSGDYDGGNGFWSTSKNDAQKELSTESVIKAGKKVITCQAVTAADKPMKPADACKTLHAM